LECNRYQLKYETSFIIWKKICKVLNKLGFREIRQRGSHKYFKHDDGRRTVVPIHSSKKIGKGLLRRIINEIQLSGELFKTKLEIEKELLALITLQ